MTLTNSLFTQILSDVKDDLEVLFTYGATGDDDTAPSATDTTLGSETFRDVIDDFDKSATSSITASLRLLTTENNSEDIKEVGWLNAAAAGTLWARNTLTTIAKTSDIQVFLDTKITITVSE